MQQAMPIMQPNPGVGMLAVDASRLADDYSYSATVPRGSQIFAVGWNDQCGVICMYSAIDPQDPHASLEMEVQRLWCVPIERLAEAAPSGAVFIGVVVAQNPDMQLCVFREDNLRV